MTSGLIGRYIRAAKLQQPDGNGKCVVIETDEADEVLIPTLRLGDSRGIPESPVT
jgi:hypothetical protein